MRCSRRKKVYLHELVFLKERYNILAKQAEVDSEQDTVATREELILDVRSSIGEAKEKCMASMPNNEDEDDILNESAIE